MSPDNYARAGSMSPDFAHGHGHGYTPMTEVELVPAPNSRTSYFSTNADDIPSTAPPPAGTSLARGGGTLRACVQGGGAPHLPLRAPKEDAVVGAGP